MIYRYIRPDLDIKFQISAIILNYSIFLELTLTSEKI